MSEVWELWTYLGEGPLLWLTLTLLAYLAGDWVSRHFGRAPWANPVLIAVVILAVVLAVTRTDYATYFEGAQFVHFLLGPATVSLAVPLFANLARLKSALLPMLAALVAGSVTAALSAYGIGWALGVEGQTLLSLLPKSATAPVAMGVSEAIGGAPSLTAVLVILTGIIGALVVTPMFNALRIRDWRARGFATGVAAHGIGTARALHVNETAGAFAGVGMGLNAILTSILAPLIVALL
ncbi:LrgB family protein [Rhodobacterales bacterium HKCCE2091]|nr:LrgB family protein [Rhodobacterales bacterium HKCCE2091]